MLCQFDKQTLFFFDAALISRKCGIVASSVSCSGLIKDTCSSTEKFSKQAHVLRLRLKIQTEFTDCRDQIQSTERLKSLTGLLNVDTHLN